MRAPTAQRFANNLHHTEMPCTERSVRHDIGLSTDTNSEQRDMRKKTKMAACPTCVPPTVESQVFLSSVMSQMVMGVRSVFQWISSNRSRFMHRPWFCNYVWNVQVILEPVLGSLCLNWPLHLLPLSQAVMITCRPAFVHPHGTKPNINIAYSLSSQRW